MRAYGQWDDGLAGGPGLSLGQHFTQQGTVPQYREKRRDYSFKSKGTNLDAATIDLVLNVSTLALGENLIAKGAIPQYSGQGRICSDQHKAEKLQQATVALVNGNRNSDHTPSTHSLGNDLLAGGAIPQTRRGKGSGKCSDKGPKCISRNGKLESAVPLRAKQWQQLIPARTILSTIISSPK